MKDELDEEAFKIATKNLIANNPKIKDIMKTEKIEQTGTNLINVIKFEKVVCRTSMSS